MSYGDSYGQQPRKEQAKPKNRLGKYLGMASSLAIVVGIGWWVLDLGVRDPSEVPVIRAIEGDVRTAPAEAGGEQADFQGLEVNSVLEGNPSGIASEVTLAPDPVDLGNIEPALVPDLPDVDLEVPTAQTIADETKTDNSIAVDMVVVTLIERPARRPELLYIPPKSQMNPLTSEAQPIGGAVSVIPSASDLVSSPEISTPTAIDLVETPAVVALEPEIVEPTPAPEPAPATDPLGARLASGTPLVQLAASPSIDDVRNQWTRLKGQHADLFADKALYIETTDVSGTLYYRLRVSGFSSGTATKSACETLLSRNVDCLAVSAR